VVQAEAVDLPVRMREGFKLWAAHQWACCGRMRQHRLLMDGTPQGSIIVDVDTR
jgi:hypothetical protein